MTNPHAARNRLGDESSPYLLQHANNPVDWYPWGEEAIQRSVGENKPIFLSIGYSACHWCHVMEHESFEDSEIAEQLNTDFISIKVDREERPDLDQIYMQAVQLMTGRGGWPMSVFLAPNLKPFYGGTYWPPRPTRGMPGFQQVLAGVKDAWDNRQQQALDQADQLTGKIEETMLQAEAGQAITDDTIWQAAVHLERSFDRTDGGFGNAPKFPRSMDLQLLLRVWYRSGRSAALEMVKTTLDKMAAGGIYDHLGGGFARYSVDERWLVPHFEKMLYDNALLTLAYLEAWQITGETRYEQVIRETMRYVQRDMTDAAGGFESTEDADSEGVEGKFYVWSLQEVEQILGGEMAERFCYVYDVTAAGNFEGSNILNCPKKLDQVAALKNWDLAELSDQMDRSREKLFAERGKRIRPGKDDKILVSWNGLMIDSMSRAGLAFDDPSMLDSALRAAEFIWNDMRSETGRLLHVWRHGHAKLDAFLDDYSCYANSLVTLYECTGEGSWLDRAVTLVDTMIEQFWDGEKSGFFFTANDHEKLITRNKDYFDSSVPSGNSMAALLLMRLGKLTGSSKYLDIARETVASSAAMLEKFPAAGGQMLLAVDMQLGPTRELVLASTNRSEIPGLISQTQRNYLPNRVVATYDGQVSSSHLKGLFEGKDADTQPKLYVCEDFACQAPTIGHEEINDRFQELAEPIGKP